MVAARRRDRDGGRALSELALYALLALGGVGAGFVNTVAGGGSLLTVPVLILLGMPATVANGTNRLAVVTQTLSGVVAFKRAGKLHTAAIPSVAIPTTIGAALGAVGAAYAPEWLLKPVLLGTMAGVALLVLLKPDFLKGPKDGEDVPPPLSLRERPAAWLGLLFAGTYGGFAQAGVGFVLLYVLGAMLRYDAARANALKLTIVLVYGVVVLGIFVAAGQVEWIPAAILATSTVLGSQLGVRFALRADGRWIRGLVFVATVASCVGAYFKD
ncbi:MAG: sulfite exporter TauE/SafE family protein [Sandaracinaceae bacterium]